MSTTVYIDANISEDQLKAAQEYVSNELLHNCNLSGLDIDVVFGDESFSYVECTDVELRELKENDFAMLLTGVNSLIEHFGYEDIAAEGG